MTRHDPRTVKPFSRFLSLEHDAYMESFGQNETRLHALCFDGSVDEIERVLLQSRGAHVNAMNENGLTPLHVAVHRSDATVTRVLELLQEHGADMDSRTLFGGDTALHLAVRNMEAAQAEPIVVKLLQLDADHSAVNDNRRSAADEAQLRGYRFLYDVLTGKMSVEKAASLQQKRALAHRGEKFVSAICEGYDEEALDALMQDDVINYVSKNGSAAVHYVITLCPVDKRRILTSLIDHGADVNLTNYENDTALNLVIKTAQLRNEGLMLELASILLQAGALFDIKDLDGNDAMDLARSRQYDDVIELLEAVAKERMPKTEPEEDPGIRNTAILFKAVTREGLEQVKEAVQLPGADVNAFNVFGLAPIHVVTRRNDVTDDIKLQMLGCLLSRDANINAVCQKDGNSLLHLIAIAKTGLEIVNYLINNGIDPMLRNQEKLQRQLADMEIQPRWFPGFTKLIKAGETAYELALRLNVKDKELKKALAAGLLKSSLCVVS